MVSKLDHGTAIAQQSAGLPPLNCPRCDSTNTKFCYYNNYSLAQPRHFCKSCKRYWTRGGTLRNVPVGGGCRKNKRAKKSYRSAAASVPSLPPPPPVIHSPATDLNPLLYGFPPMMNSSPVFFPKFDAQLVGYEETFQSCLSVANLADLQKTAAPPADFLGDYTMLNSQIPSSSFPFEATNSFAASAGTGPVSQAFLYWNQAMSGGWPESGSSVAPLI